jgi:predicted murein hydrolase (TIGR00659 family)
MNEWLSSATYWGIPLTIVAYQIGLLVKKRFKLSIFNPMIVAIILIIPLLKLLNISYDTYYDSNAVMNYLLTPATICLAVPLYEKVQILKDNIMAILAGILSGVLTAMVSIFTICKLFSLDKEIFVTFLPKSLTTAIGMAISEELGGIVAITVAVIMITGITGDVISDVIFKVFKIDEPVSRGLALGTASHVIGTVRASQYGKVEGAVSSLSIATTGLFTVIIAPMFANFY